MLALVTSEPLAQHHRPLLADQLAQGSRPSPRRRSGGRRAQGEAATSGAKMEEASWLTNSDKELAGWPSHCKVLLAAAAAIAAADDAYAAFC